MKQFNGEGIREQRGIVLIIAMLVMAILSVLGLAFLTTARTEDTIAANYRNHTAAFYAAEAGIESGVASLKTTLGANPNASDATLAAIVPAALTDPNYTFSAFQVRRVRPTPYPTTIDSGPFVGLNGFSTAYEVSATATGPRGSRARLTQRVNYVQVPLFQFAIFYGRGVDLDISPNPAARFNGRIHSNSNMYLNENIDVKFDGRMTSAGNVYRYSKVDGPGTRGGNPDIWNAATGRYEVLNFDHEYNYDFASRWSESDWARAALDRFGGRLQDSAMGVQEIRPPLPDVLYDPARPDDSSHLMIEKGVAGDTPEMRDAKMYYKADVRIENGVVKDRNGDPINLSARGCDRNTVTTKTFYDPREQRNIQITEIDIGKMNACGVMPANGILWAHHDGSNKGIRLKGGSQLPSTGLTVASENPVYIMGDYNTVNKVPAAVMGDAIYALSNNWERRDYDDRGRDDVDEREASNTTINAALMLGYHAEATRGNPNGEHENIIRLLEDWRDDAPYPASEHTLTYNGSVVSLWHSKQARAPFDNGTRYRTPPNRPWSYDTLFDTQLPPGTPMGIIYTRGQWSEG